MKKNKIEVRVVSFVVGNFLGQPIVHNMIVESEKRKRRK
jgi:hypothetical protein